MLKKKSFVLSISISIYLFILSSVDQSAVQREKYKLKYKQLQGNYFHI